MADAGCEVCHGPGYDHVESGGDTDLIVGKLSIADCEHCHNPERVAAFDFKPLLYGGAHQETIMKIRFLDAACGIRLH